MARPQVLTHVSTDGHLGPFRFLTTTNSAAVSTQGRDRVWLFAFTRLGWTPGGGISGSCGSSMFNHLKPRQAVFHLTFPPVDFQLLDILTHQHPPT